MESNYSCLIVDDEYPAHDVIKSLLKGYSNLTFVKNCYNGEDALHEIKTGLYDIVFLDINMPILNGIDLLKEIDNKPAIVITTAYTNFAFEAYENDAVDYLQKPISEQRFKKAITKAIDYTKQHTMANLKPLVLVIDGIKRTVQQNKIIYCQTMGNYLRIFLEAMPKPIIIKNTLANQLCELNPTLFFQVHRTCIVNKNFILGRKQNQLIILNNIHLPIGRKYMSNIENSLFH